MSALCAKLGVVPEPRPRGMPARDPDRLIKWFIGVVVMGVGVNLLSGFVVAQKWAWLPSAVFVAALLVAVRSAGLLRRERYRHNAGSEHGIARADRLCGGRGGGISDWVAPCSDDLVPRRTSGRLG